MSRSVPPIKALWHESQSVHLHRDRTVNIARHRNRFEKIRAKVEYVFQVMKCQFGYRKVRYRGIAKNGAQVFALLALANLFLAPGTAVRITATGEGSCA